MQGSDFHEQMARFDARRGKTMTFDPTKIEGPPVAAAPPEDVTVPSAAELHGTPIEPDFTDEALEGNGRPPESPLVSRGLDALAEPAPRFEPVVVTTVWPPASEVVLWVTDRVARLRGQEITLTEEDAKKIEAILVKSLRASLRLKQAELDKQYLALTGGKPRTRRKKAGSRKKPAGASS